MEGALFRTQRVSSTSGSEAGHEASNSRSEAQKERVSTACSYCRHRKVKCDGKQPMCTFCQHLGRESCEYTKVSEEDNLRLRRRKRELRARRNLERQQHPGLHAQKSLSENVPVASSSRAVAGKARANSATTASQRKSVPSLALASTDGSVGRARSLSGMPMQGIPRGNVFAGSLSAQSAQMSGLPRELRTTFSPDTVPGLSRSLDDDVNSPHSGPSAASNQQGTYDTSAYLRMPYSTAIGGNVSPTQLMMSPALQGSSQSSHNTPSVDGAAMEASGLAGPPTILSSAFYSPQTLPTAQDYLANLSWNFEVTASQPSTSNSSLMPSQSLVRDGFLSQSGQCEAMPVPPIDEAQGQTNSEQQTTSTPAYNDYDSLDPFFVLAHDDKASPGNASSDCSASIAMTTLTPSMVFDLASGQAISEESTWAKPKGMPDYLLSYLQQYSLKHASE